LYRWDRKEVKHYNQLKKEVYHIIGQGLIGSDFNGTIPIVYDYALDTFGDM
jgi:hypothetical protein